MKVDDLIVYGKKKIEANHAKLLLSNLLNLNPLELLNYLDKEVDENTIELYKKEIDAVKNNKPIQYVLGNVNFYGNPFKVNENVLIPRFETEELVEQTLVYIKEIFKEDNINILDLCTGTGCIGLTLKKKLPNSKVTLTDISEKALEVANYNAKNLNLEVEIENSDIFETLNKDNKYDVIISNPPYIKQDEEIEAIVKENEPNIALYAGIDGLDIYRKIIKDMKNYLNEKFIVAFEIGMTQKQDIIDLVNESLTNVKIISKQDLSGKDRMIFIIKE